MKICAFPNCENHCQKRSAKKVATFRWCRFHRVGGGKKDRLALAPSTTNNISQPSQNKPDLAFGNTVNEKGG